MTPAQWILGLDTGVSSKTIWAVMMGEANTDRGPFGYDTPHDPSDFGRCYRLLRHFPKWKSRLHELAEKFPKWAPMVREWDKMSELYERDLSSGTSTELYELIQKLEDEGRLADGWIKTSPCSWERKQRDEPT